MVIIIILEHLDFFSECVYQSLQFCGFFKTLFTLKIVFNMHAYISSSTY